MSLSFFWNRSRGPSSHNHPTKTRFPVSPLEYRTLKRYRFPKETDPQCSDHIPPDLDATVMDDSFVLTISVRSELSENRWDVAPVSNTVLRRLELVVLNAVSKYEMLFLSSLTTSSSWVQVNWEASKVTQNLFFPFMSLSQSKNFFHLWVLQCSSVGPEWPRGQVRLLGRFSIPISLFLTLRLPPLSWWEWEG